MGVLNKKVNFFVPKKTKDVRECLEKVIDSGRPGEYLFTGEILNNRFKIFKKPKGRNSFVSILNGEIQKTKGGAQIIIEARLDTRVFLFLILWFLFIIYSAATNFLEGSERWPYSAVMLILVACYFSYKFHKNTKASINELKQVLSIHT